MLIFIIGSPLAAVPIRINAQRTQDAAGGDADQSPARVQHASMTGHRAT
jgi:hypothetical protein